MFKRLRLNINYRNKLLLSLAVTSVVPIVVVAFFAYSQFVGVLEDKITHSMSQTLQQNELNISKRLQQAADAAGLIIGSEEFRKANMPDAGKPLYEAIRDYEELNSFMDKLQRTYSFFHIRLYMNRSYLDTNVYSLQQLLATSDFGNVLAEPYGLHWKALTDEKGNRLVSAYQIINNPLDYDEISAVLFIDLEESELTALTQSIGMEEGRRTIVIDEEGRIAFGAEPQRFRTAWSSPLPQPLSQYADGAYKTGGSLNIIRRIPLSGWRIVSEIPLNQLLKESRAIRDSIVWGAVAMLAVVALVSFLLAHSLTRRLKLLLKGMDASRWKEGDEAHLEEVELKAVSHEGDEMDRLIYTYNRMVRRIRGLIEQVYRVRLNETQAKLEALQSQINPHFLYNTLDSIKSCLDGRRNELASDMLLSLSKFFRLALSKGADRITVRQELEMIAQYLHIQKMHYGNKIEWEIDVDKSMDRCLIMKFTLQPIVENCIYHGIRNKRGKGIIRITGSMDGEIMRIAVSDDGVGMDSRTLEGVAKTIDSGTFAADGGYGLGNVNARLKLYFGNAYGLQADSAPGAGTRITVTIPNTASLTRGVLSIE
ncbi:cache domain-containing sensor histidine kinase [Paenibacillus thalictri]|uniref:histidine kinase n=1 Tax=Paenibacillus thalictri TaxID=2527873 RepID=A0A4Q9DUF4_9BACL|nr:sensor histidine kinase [Paenibacillus thalictri]TBL80617.1 sensor histidine kinase [Paenibacillus thalictri]